MGFFGFGTTEKNESTSVNNQQVASQSGIATGGTGNSSNISILTADPEIAKAAISGQAFTSANAISGINKTAGQAFDFASGAVGAVEQANATTAASIQNIGALSILGANDLSKKFADSVSDTDSKNISLLQGIAQNENQQSQQAQQLAKDSLDASFTNAARSTQQTVGYTTESTIGSLSKLFLYAIIGLVVIGVSYAFFRRKSA